MNNRGEPRWGRRGHPVRGRCIPWYWAAIPLIALAGSGAFAHNVEARYIKPLDWQQPHFAHIYGMGYAELGHDLDVSHVEMRTIAGRRCAVGNMIAFEVDRSFAYDIDEPVELTLTYVPKLTTTPLLVLWNQNGGLGRGELRVLVTPGAQFRTATVTLERARFANFGTRGVDLAIATTDDKDGGLPDGHVAVCEVRLVRHPAAHSPVASGRVRLDIQDAGTGSAIPARVGLYDATGRAPLPSGDALLVERFADHTRLLSVDPRAFWPSQSRVAFYVKGQYEAEVPAGQYELVATHGPEFHAYRGQLEVRPGETTVVSVRLERYADLPAHGWYSGDDHIHLARDETRDLTVWTQVAAEDVHVGNLLQMGNIAGTYFEQPEWGKAGRFEQGGYLIASGQEDPRTGHLGHTIHENLERPLHLGADQYFLYHRVFDESHRQKGISGYAHINGGWFNVKRGMALDIPLGGVDFLEIFQAGKLSVDSWYDFLNLGFRITPSAGSDFPYTDLPGVVRVYARVAGPLDADAWYEAFRAGHAYVSNGPLLEFTVNGHGMGETVHVAPGAPLDVEASVRLNPDIDRLDRLELVVLGDVVATATAHGEDHAALTTRQVALHSQWMAVRAYGGRQAEWNTTGAHSAPIYVVVDDRPTWKKESVASIVARERAALREIATAPLVPTEDLEAFETRALLLKQWPRQLELLRPRLEAADRKYAELLRRSRQLPAH